MLLKPVEERRALVTAAILADPAKSARQIAIDLGVTYSMVVRHQVALIRAGKIPAELRIRGSDGRTYDPAIRMQVSSGLQYHISRIRAISKVIEGKPWQKADPRSRRQLWLAAVKLAESIGDQIDVTTGHLTEEPIKPASRARAERRARGETQSAQSTQAAQVNSDARTPIASTIASTNGNQGMVM